MAIDPVSLAARILAAALVAVGKYAWSRYRAHRAVYEDLARVASEVMTDAIIRLAEDHNVTDLEVTHFGHLVGGFLDSHDLYIFLFVEHPTHEGGAVSEAQYVEAMLERLRNDEHVDIDTMSLPIREVLHLFLNLLPLAIHTEAAKPTSRLFQSQVLKLLQAVTKTTRDVDESNALRGAIADIRSLDPAKVELGLDAISRVGARLNRPDRIVPVVCGLLRSLYRSPSSPYTDDMEDAFTLEYIEVRLLEVLRGALATVGTGSHPQEVNLTGATLLSLDLSGLEIGTLTLDRAQISGALKLRGSHVIGSATMRSCTASTADFAGARFAETLSCARATFSILDLSGMVVIGGVNFERAILDGPVSLGDESHGYAEFRDQLSFHHASFGEPADLGGLIVRDFCSLTDSSFFGVARLTRGHFLQGLDMARASMLGVLDLRSAHIFGDLELELGECSRLRVDGAMTEVISSVKLAPEHLHDLWIEERGASKILHDSP